MSIDIMGKIYEVRCQDGPVTGTVEVPGSKSITNRALLLAALAQGTSTVKGVLFSKDSQVFLEALTSLGIQMEVNEKCHEVRLQGTGGVLPVKEGRIYVGSAGTAARFITAIAGLSDGKYEMESSPQMKKRPMKDLLQALECLGANICYKEEPYAFPFEIEGAGGGRGDVEEIPLNIDKSSQYLSALLMAAPMLKKDITIRLTGKRSAKSYVAITQRMMEEFGVDVIGQLGEDIYQIRSGGRYKAREYQVEPDVSAACYFYGMAAVTGGSMTVRHVTPDSMQGDIRFLHVLEQMGCSVQETPEGLCVSGAVDGALEGIHVCMSDFSDQTMTLAAIAPFAKDVVEITGVSHIRRQESNRIQAICQELTRMGIVCEELDDGIRIHPGKPMAALVQTYDDHRMAMAFSLTGLRAPGIVIADPACCSKTFAEYFQVFDKLTGGTAGSI